jgi:ribulose-5-phosphate 4-epimerase/fuculose-1-phosphate aldolase
MNKTKMLLVGGNFEENIRSSGYVRKMYERLSTDPLFDIVYLNGGSYQELTDMVTRAKEFPLILWFANVPNYLGKQVNLLKVFNPETILVTSKNNLDGRYSYQEIVARMLLTKANLSLVFTGGSATGNAVSGTLMDPLGNAFVKESQDIEEVCSVLKKRALQLMTYSRAKSVSIGEALVVPYEENFFGIARRFAERFHELIHAHDTKRFLGYLSFRCENGFPSFVKGKTVYVSRRNIDKRMIGPEGFVGVSLDTQSDGAVAFYGENKPSVDTPVQVALYNKLPKVRYMMHSHVYVDGYPFTDEKIPCGALEEVDSILSLLEKEVGSLDSVQDYALNLYGHGSIVFARDLRFFNTIHYKARDLPEMDWNKKSKTLSQATMEDLCNQDPIEEIVGYLSKTWEGLEGLKPKEGISHPESLFQGLVDDDSQHWGTISLPTRLSKKIVDYAMDDQGQSPLASLVEACFQYGRVYQKRSQHLKDQERTQKLGVIEYMKESLNHNISATINGEEPKTKEDIEFFERIVLRHFLSDILKRYGHLLDKKD